MTPMMNNDESSSHCDVVIIKPWNILTCPSKVQESFLNKWLSPSKNVIIKTDFLSFFIWLTLFAILTVSAISWAIPNKVLMEPTHITNWHLNKWPEMVEAGLVPMLPADPIVQHPRKRFIIQFIFVYLLSIGIGMVMVVPTYVRYLMFNGKDIYISKSIPESIKNLTIVLNELNLERKSALKVKSEDKNQKAKKLDLKAKQLLRSAGEMCDELDWRQLKNYQSLVNRYFYRSNRDKHLKLIGEYPARVVPKGCPKSNEIVDWIALSVNRWQERFNYLISNDNFVCQRVLKEFLHFDDSFTSEVKEITDGVLKLTKDIEDFIKEYKGFNIPTVKKLTLGEIIIQKSVVKSSVDLMPIYQNVMELAAEVKLGTVHGEPDLNCLIDMCCKISKNLRKLRADKSGNSSTIEKFTLFSSSSSDGGCEGNGNSIKTTTTTSSSSSGSSSSPSTSSTSSSCSSAAKTTKRSKSSAAAIPKSKSKSKSKSTSRHNKESSTSSAHAGAVTSSKKKKSNGKRPIKKHQSKSHRSSTSSSTSSSCSSPLGLFGFNDD